jgi:hypothetical protein
MKKSKIPDVVITYERIQAYKKKKYIEKWSLNRSRVHFFLKVVGEWLKGRPGMLFAYGGHYIDGPSGAGKTLLMNIILENMLKSGGFAWQNINEFFYKPVKTFDIFDMFAGAKQVYRLDPVDQDGRYCKALVLDEVNSTFNRRQNKQRDYNDVFVPLVKFLTTHRHQKIPRFYLIGQSLLLQDSQLQEIIKYRHYVQAKKRWRYWFWRNELKMAVVPVSLKITNFLKVGTDENGHPIWRELRPKMKIKVVPWMLETYNTHAFAELFAGLPLYSSKPKDK